MFSSLTAHTALAAFILIFLLNAARRWISSRRSARASLQRTMLMQEIAALRQEAERYNNPATYVKCAKLQRTANAKEKELAAAEASGMQTSEALISKALLLLKVITIAWVVFRFWGHPLVEVPASVLKPVGSALAFPHAWSLAGTGAITAIPWISLSDQASELILKLLMPSHQQKLPASD